MIICCWLVDEMSVHKMLIDQMFADMMLVYEIFIRQDVCKQDV
jgi:hypothetical protein